MVVLKGFLGFLSSACKGFTIIVLRCRSLPGLGCCLTFPMLAGSFLKGVLAGSGGLRQNV